MDTTSYVIEVNHHYDGNGGGSSTAPSTDTVAKPKNRNIGVIDNEKIRKNESKTLKQMALIGGAFAYNTMKEIGEYTGDYGTTRKVNNSIKAVGIVASLANPYTAAMALIGVANSVMDFSIKKRDSDFKAQTLKQISGGINNGYKGRKL